MWRKMLINKSKHTYNDLMQAFRDIFRIDWYWFIIISTLHNMLEMMMKGEKIDTPRKRQKVCKKVKWMQNCGKVLPSNSSQRLACHQWSTSHTHTLSHSSPHANPFPHPKNVFLETYFSACIPAFELHRRAAASKTITVKMNSVR